MNKRLLPLTMLCLVFALVLAGCGGTAAEEGKPASGKQQASGKPAEPHDPVTLKLYADQSMSQEDLDLLINEPVQKKYPYITVEFISKSKNTLENQVASGQQLDLITVYNGHIPSFKELGIFEDLAPMVKKAGFDLGRFDPQTLETMKAIADHGELYGIPYNVQFNALYYNKDIFDKFGVAYPKDGMTWDDAIELAKKLTREDGGVQYHGLNPESIIRLMYPLSQTVVDGKTNKATVNSEPYKKLFDVGYRIYSIPGNTLEKGVSSNDAFMKNQNVAMFATVNLFDKIAQIPEFNWDVAQYPSYKDNPNVYGMYDLHVISISSTSKFKDEAMKVLEVLFSDEVQMISTQETGRVSPLKDPKFKQAYGADMPILKGKHIQSIFKSKNAPAPPFSIYYTKTRDMLSKHFTSYLEGEEDTNTALRNAEEDINSYIKSVSGP